MPYRLYLLDNLYSLGTEKKLYKKRVGELEKDKEISNNVQQNDEENFAPKEESLLGEDLTVKVLHTKDNSIEEMKMDEYLLGVVSAEMPANFEEEALKAQAVVARTYTMYIIEHNSNKHEGADICDNSACCQAWISKEDRFARWKESERESNWDKIKEAVNSTSRKVTNNLY